MFDNFLYKYRFAIGGVLIAIILVGSGLIFWDKFSQNKVKLENAEIMVLREQNELLRKQLSQNAQKQIAGAQTQAISSASNISNISNKININTATAAELDKLPGIGPARANDIINYRQAHNGFKTIEELKNIKGIGDKSFESLKDLVTVGNN
jgi:competence protein ComEA